MENRDDSAAMIIIALLIVVAVAIPPILIFYYIYSKRHNMLKLSLSDKASDQETEELELTNTAKNRKLFKSFEKIANDQGFSTYVYKYDKENPNDCKNLTREV